MPVEPAGSDADFMGALRIAVERYLAAVDAWDAAYQKYYRLPGFAERAGSDLATEQAEYRCRRRELEALLPRARRLCLKHNQRDVFIGLLRISLGRYAPQQRLDPTIGRSERTVVAKCMVELQDACREWAAPESPRPGKSWLNRASRLFSRRL